MASSPTHSSSSVSAPSHGSPPFHGEEPKNPKKSKKKTKIYVTERGKKSIEVEVQNHETIEVIKKRIMVEHNIPLRHQHLLVSVTDSRRHDRGSIFDIDKFDDAKLAGTERSSECTLILTEEDSEKALVMSRLSALRQSDRQSDKERYNRIGVFPLCGKLMNASKNYGRIHSNKVVQNLMIILGIKPDDGDKEDKQDDGEEEEEEDGSCFSRLRYGSVMLMMDSDEDGSHIKGLIVHLFNQPWPSLLKSLKFLFDFATPILKATPRSSQKPQEPQEQPSYFYSSSVYEEWRAKNCNENSYDIKHYKAALVGGWAQVQKRKEENISWINLYVSFCSNINLYVSFCALCLSLYFTNYHVGLYIFHFSQKREHLHCLMLAYKIAI